VRFQFGEFQLDDERYTLAGPEGPVHVEPQVFEVLHHLIVNRDRVVAKHELFDAIWGHRFVSESALTSRLKSARRAVGDDGSAQRIIKTVHGRGYQFVAEVRSGAGRVRRALPRLRNEVIGRDSDVAHITDLVRGGAPVTITGSGGMGKTTLALTVADRLQAEYADGAIFVDLAPVPHRGDVTRAVADAAGVEGAASASIESVADHLADRPVLLVIDNCEHVIASSAQLVDRLLALGGSAHILATSREPLGVAGEHVWPLGPLHEDGANLFVERARAAEPRVHWDATDPAVIEICRRLDDVPLALELAAGQLRRFDLSELLRLLDDRLALQWGHVAGWARHATMETTIDWSYRLLEPIEQSLLRQLSVFPSSFDVRAVEASAPPLLGSLPLAVFGQLVDKSLVVRLPGSGRYRLLETIRAFSRDRLDESGEAAAAFERHRGHVRDRIASTSRLDRWLSARLAAEFRNDLEDARQAFRLSVERGEVGDAVEIAIGSSFLWRNALGCSEGDAWLDDLQAQQLVVGDQHWLHILRADVGQGRGDHRQMFGAAAAAIATGDPATDPAGACLAAHYGALAHLTDAERARGSFADAVELARQSGDSRLFTLIQVFAAVGDLAAGQHDQMRAALERLAQQSSPEGYDSFILHWAGWMLGLAERDQVAARHWMGLQQEFLDRTGIVETWITLFSTAMCDVIDGTDVRQMLSRTLALADREGYQADADCVLVLAYAEMCARRFEVAAELIGTAVRDRFNSTAHYVLYSSVLDRTLRDVLDADVVTEAMTRGRARTAADALAEYGVTRPAGLAAKR
jgi:predicted ATPase/DNA-binding winged helix-turn-helix (wHTH) protein